MRHSCISSCSTRLKQLQGSKTKTMTYYENGAQFRIPFSLREVMTATGLGATADIPKP